MQRGLALCAKAPAMQRRHFLASASFPLLGCQKTPPIEGGFIGADPARGHLLRQPQPLRMPAKTQRTRVLILGGGVSGLAAARALQHKGMHDFALLELEDTLGGNSRGTVVNGLPCPMGAHYLPAPTDDAPEVQHLLEELGLRQRIAGRWVLNERHLCHSPQERLFIHGTWQEGLLPLHDIGADTLAQYQQFTALVQHARSTARWTVPVRHTRALHPVQRSLASITFAAYLQQTGLIDPHLRWYLDYCCRDEYGADSRTVSAWAGIHYFASRHGFSAPGQEHEEHDGVFTWPEGNAWLTQRLAAPVQNQMHTGQVVLRVTATKHAVEVDVFNATTQSTERWHAKHAIVALPIFIAAKVVQNTPPLLQHAAQHTTYAPWLVANIHIHTALNDRLGAAPSWDNVLYGSQTLGYVDAMHQSLHPVPGATVLTHYRALGDSAGGAAGRKLLLEQPWSYWRDTVFTEFASCHPDLRSKTSRIEISRYGHAMAIPTPSVSGRLGYSLQERKQGRLSFAHSDWAGYSVFEEAFTMGHAAGSAL